MGDIHESVSLGHLSCPLFNLLVNQFDRTVALSASQMVMMFDLTTHAISRDVVLVSNHVDSARFNQIFERPVDGGQACLRTR
jgi:hypothetical protein